MMIRILCLSAIFAFASPALAQDPHATHDHADHQHGDHAHDHEDQAGDVGATGSPVSLSRSPEIDAALQAGGEPVVVEVLGVVCDFCAKAMNRTFGKREEVSAVYVDLDTKTLNIVFQPGATMDDREIDRLVGRAGYKTKAIHRGDAVGGGADAPDPA
jgi:hypothetical protein